MLWSTFDVRSYPKTGRDPTACPRPLKANSGQTVRLPPCKIRINCAQAPSGQHEVRLNLKLVRTTESDYIEKRCPRENSYIKAFNGELRDELLNGEILYSLREAQVVIEQ